MKQQDHILLECLFHLIPLLWSATVLHQNVASTSNPSVHIDLKRPECRNIRIKSCVQNKNLLDNPKDKMENFEQNSRK